MSWELDIGTAMAQYTPVACTPNCGPVSSSNYSFSNDSTQLRFMQRPVDPVNNNNNIPQLPASFPGGDGYLPAASAPSARTVQESDDTHLVGCCVEQGASRVPRARPPKHRLDSTITEPPSRALLGRPQKRRVSFTRAAPSCLCADTSIRSHPVLQFFQNYIKCFVDSLIQETLFLDSEN